ncbi:4Fe-4S dicluster domain-containing protein [Dethiobacter alkaliphilus]|uniref:4Fe-4S ferredoxin iron-sulfur binding domain protein n=1 Tax=Dethiobacter alkaliphilus AHT 1 TaxID=555088 RepID=C0GDH3_DETAL|nr:4Fe-4S dicluster domain-containing protein [Dethiobacter alkaliphilus]EEG78694.1 4Fe-4S ferredoxin iron-sulfur binding domain protein [Dethiobacter alkaliphilus AHT 1]
MKRIRIKEEHCMGCRLCEIHCIAAHSAYRYDLVRTFKRDKNRPSPRIMIEQSGHTCFALPCRHCEEANCVKACISGSMTKDLQSGLVTNDSERCVGCWTCIAACPYGVITREGKKISVAAKCDLCGDKPVCVQQCPNEALVCDDQEEGA